MKTKTILEITICVICAVTLMSGCIDSGYEDTEEREVYLVEVPYQRNDCPPRTGVYNIVSLGTS